MIDYQIKCAFIEYVSILALEVSGVIIIVLRASVKVIEGTKYIYDQQTHTITKTYLQCSTLRYPDPSASTLSVIQEPATKRKSRNKNFLETTDVGHAKRWNQTASSRFNNQCHASSWWVLALSGSSFKVAQLERGSFSSYWHENKGNTIGSRNLPLADRHSALRERRCESAVA